MIPTILDGCNRGRVHVLSGRCQEKVGRQTGGQIKSLPIHFLCPLLWHTFLGACVAAGAGVGLRVAGRLERNFVSLELEFGSLRLPWLRSLR